MGTVSIAPMSLPDLIGCMSKRRHRSRIPIAIAAGDLHVATVVRLARQLGHLPVVIHTPLELFWLLDDQRVSVELVIGANELPTANGHDLLTVVVEEWPHISALVLDGNRGGSPTRRVTPAARSAVTARLG